MQDHLEDFKLTYHGLEKSEAYLERVITEKGPFDGLMGFSQVRGFGLQLGLLPLVNHTCFYQS